MSNMMCKTISPQVISFSQVISLPQQVSEEVEESFEEEFFEESTDSIWFSHDSDVLLDEEVEWCNQFSEEEVEVQTSSIVFSRPLQIPSMASERKLKEEAEEKARLEIEESMPAPKSLFSNLVGRVVKAGVPIVEKEVVVATEEEVVVVEKEVVVAEEKDTTHFSMRNVNDKILAKVFGSRRQNAPTAFVPKTQAQVISEIQESRRARRSRQVTLASVAPKTRVQIVEEFNQTIDDKKKNHVCYNDQEQSKKAEEQAQRFLQSQKMNIVVINNSRPSEENVKAKKVTKVEIKDETKVEKKDDGFTEIKRKTPSPVQEKQDDKKIVLGFFDSQARHEKVRSSVDDKKTKLVKSNMCRLVLETGKCTRSECNFAHTIAELNPYQCEFGNKCKFFTEESKKCNHFHPSETKESYCARRGIKEFVAIVEKPVEPVKKFVVHQGPICQTGDLAKFWNAKTETLRKEAESNPNRVIQPVVKTEARQEVQQEVKTAQPLQLVKSKMCSNILTQGRCHRAVCNFAHTLEELTPSRCNWGQTCRHMHSEERPCVFIHDGESKESWLQRTRLYPQLKPVVKPVVKLVEKLVEKPVEKRVSRWDAPVAKAVEKRSSRWDVLAEPEPVIIRVPKGVDPRTIANLVSSSQISNIKVIYE